jgi:hypothetical protein
VGLFEKLRLGSRQWAKTIVEVQQARLKNAGVVGPQSSFVTDAASEHIRRDAFKIRLAHDEERARDARFLVEKRYGEKGYATAGTNGHPASPERITLATYKDEEVVGTLSVGFDTGSGLFADELYKAEVDAYRDRPGSLVCEFTKLAIDSRRASKRMMAGLFHIAYLYAHRIWGYTDILIEVNPSHVSFYENMLGFEVCGPERMCTRVGAPAVLLRLDAFHAERMIRQFGGRAGQNRQEKTLYPYFLAPEEEESIIKRLANS